MIFGLPSLAILIGFLLANQPGALLDWARSHIKNFSARNSTIVRMAPTLQTSRSVSRRLSDSMD